tara:strand:+ start:106 stop:591 length:486 start_codon:yes stop_codon:yes gene_type:complete
MERAPVIRVVGQSQQLVYHKDDKTLTYQIATATKGFGEKEGSFQTPRGWHRICAKFGDGLDQQAVLVGRQFTGEIYTPALAQAHPERTWILSRILWLEGLEPGKNQGGDVDSRSRYIYIHGAPELSDGTLPGSIGCVQMRGAEMIELYDAVQVGDVVLIEE